MSAWKYKQLMPAVLVNKLRLIDPKEILELVDKPIEQIYAALARTPYHAEISEIKSEGADSASLEQAFLRNFINTCRDVMESSPRNIRALLASILRKFEASNVKAILRAKAAQASLDHAMKLVVPVGELDCAKCAEIFAESESVGDVVRHLSDVGYGKALSQALGEYEQTGQLLPLEVATDRHTYRGIWRSVGKLKGLDGRIAKTVMGLEIDSMNVRTILRCKDMGMDPDRIMRYLLPMSDVFGRAELRGAVETTDIASALRTLMKAAKLGLANDYQYLLVELMEAYNVHKSISRLETLLERGLLRTSLRMLKRYTPFFNIGSILAFLNLKWFETRNLRIVIRGAEEGIPPSAVKELLVLPS